MEMVHVFPARGGVVRIIHSNIEVLKVATFQRCILDVLFREINACVVVVVYDTIHRTTPSISRLR